MKGTKLFCGEFCYYCCQNFVVIESNKVAIELRVMQFWSEIILEITRMISDQIA